MQSIDELKVNNAIQACLCRCEQSSAVLPEIAKFIDNLETSGGWREAELEEVEKGVLAMVFGILDCAMYPGELADRQRSSASLSVLR